ncbi:MAG TPA: hypothetical protein VL422_07810 [Miltoncostaea sp.]|nr:hypothetical protein [Miltoncostaea sp.]
MTSTSARPAAARRRRSERPAAGLRTRAIATAARAASISGSPPSITSVPQSGSAASTIPPGRTRRAISRTTAAGSSTCWSRRSQRQPSATPSSSGIPVASATRNSPGAALPAAERRRASAIIDSLMSTPIARPPGEVRSARARTSSPGPHPTSTITAPGPASTRSKESVFQRATASSLPTASR